MGLPARQQAFPTDHQQLSSTPYQHVASPLLGMMMLSAIFLVIGLVMVDCNHGNMTERRRLTTTDQLRKDLPFPDFFVLGAMKCGTTSLVTLTFT